MPLELADLAREVHGQCATLARSLDALRGMPPEEVEEALSAHLKRTVPVERALKDAVARLNARRGELQGMPPAERAGVEAAVAEARGLLEDAARAYAVLSADAARVLSDIRRRLDDAHQGARLLRTYRRAAQR